MQKEKKETILQGKILKDLRSLGKYCLAFKIIRTSDNGVPDIFFTTAITGGILIEVKKIRGEKRTNQIHVVNKLNSCGTKSYFCETWKEWWELKSSLGLLNKEGIIYAHKKLNE